MSLQDLQTRRLQAMPWAELSAFEVAELFAPKVVQWLPEGFRTPVDDAARRAFLAEVSGQAEVVALRDRSGQGIGLVVLSLPEKGQSTRHLGYLFAESAWGQGLASELLAGLQARFRGSSVILSGGVMQENAASARVLVKAGFRAELSGPETIYTWHAGAGRGRTGDAAVSAQV